MIWSRIWKILVALVFLAALVTVLVSTLKIVNVDENIPPSYLASRDLYLALEKTLSDDFYVERYDDAATALEEKPSLLILDASQANRISRYELDAWVKHGGRLLLSWGQKDSDPDLGYSDSGTLFEGLKPDFDLSSDLILKALADGMKPVTTDGSVSFPDAPKDATLYRNTGRNLLVIRNYGEGFILVCGTPEFLGFTHLGESGSKDLLAALMRGIDPDSGPILLPAYFDSSTLRNSKAETWPLILSLLLVIVILVWMRMPRFGPTIPERSADRRSLGDRFLAEGRFLWSHGVRIDESLIEGKNPEAQETDTAKKRGGTGRAGRKKFIDFIGTKVRGKYKEGT